eukprot:1674129-Prymnesium_polylepis.1
MNWYRVSDRQIKATSPRNITCRKRRRELLSRTSQLEPESEAERHRCVGSASTPTEDAVAVERTVGCEKLF